MFTRFFLKSHQIRTFQFSMLVDCLKLQCFIHVWTSAITSSRHRMLINKKTFKACVNFIIVTIYVDIITQKWERKETKQIFPLEIVNCHNGQVFLVQIYFSFDLFSVEIRCFQHTKFSLLPMSVVDPFRGFPADTTL